MTHTLPTALVLALLTLAGCTPDPVSSCHTMAHDCCTTDEHCTTAYDDVAPYCLRGASGEGTCGQCMSASDCQGAPCITDPHVGSYCATP